MGPVVELTPAEATVEPGGTLQLAVRVHNPSDIVEGYRLDVIGEAAAWAEVSPPEVNVYPGKDATASVLLRPPVHALGLRGPVPFGVRVVSVKDRLRATVEEGIVHIGEQVAATIAVTPEEIACRRKASFQVEVANRGNIPLNLRLRASEAGATVRCHIEPQVVTVQPGQSAWAMLSANPTPNLRGPEARHKIDVSCAEHDPETPVWAPFSPRSRQGVTASTSVALVQRPLLPRRAIGGVSLAALLAVGGLAYKTAQPAKPAVASVTQTAQDQAVVEFKPVARARKNYEVIRYQADRSTRAEGAAVKVAAPNGAATLTATVGGLAPGTHCFGVKAVGMLGFSSQSAVAEDDCVVIAALTLEAPTDFALAKGDEPKQFALSWKPRDGEVYQVLRDNRPDGEPVEGESTVVEAAKYTCFRVQAVLASDKAKKSKPTDQRCAGGAVYRVIVFGGKEPPDGIDAVVDRAAQHFGWNRDEMLSDKPNGLARVASPPLPNLKAGQDLCRAKGAGWSDGRQLSCQTEKFDE